jgi:hypothetical protein
MNLFFKKSDLKIYLFCLTIFCIYISNANGQNLISKGPSYNNPIQIDSSDFYLIPKIVDKSNANEYSQDLRDYRDLIITDVIIYNSKTFTTKSLFSKQRSFIYPINGSFESEMTTIYPPLSGFTNSFKSSLILRDKLIFIAITSDFNKDGLLSEEDALSIYISEKNGENFRQITPPNLNLTGLTFSKDLKTLFITLQNDSDNDKSFKDEQGTLYQINLDKQFSNLELIKILL